MPKTTFIKEVIVWRGDWINAIQFITEGGNDSDRYGDPAGGERVPIQDPEGGSLRQVNGKFGDYVNQLELMFGLPYYVDDIDIKVDEPLKQIRFSNPKQIDVNIGNNCSNRAGTVRFNNTFTKTATQSHSFRFSNTTGVELSTTFKVGVPLIADGEVGVSASTSFEFETTDGAEKTDSISRNYDYTVPEGRRIDAAFMAKEAVVKLPFSYNLYHYRNGNKKDRLEPKAYTGVYDGVLIASAETMLYEVDCKTGQRVREIASADEIKPIPAPTRIVEPAKKDVTPAVSDTRPPALAQAGGDFGAPSGDVDGDPSDEHVDGGVTPHTVKQVSTSSGAAFIEGKDGFWHETSAAGVRRFSFEVIDRSDDCLYLLDTARGVLIVLDFVRNKVQYAGSVDEEPVDLYDITGKS